MFDLLSGLNSVSADIEASAIVLIDGIVIASVLPKGLDEDSIGAMSAALLSVSVRSSQMLLNGVMEQVSVKNSNGYILIVRAGKEAVITVLTKPRADLDRIATLIKPSADKIIAHINQLELAA